MIRVRKRQNIVYREDWRIVVSVYLSLEDVMFGTLTLFLSQPSR